MSTPSKNALEQILEHLVNEDTDKAESLLHEFIVAKSRSIYESVVNEEDEACDDMDDEVEKDDEEVKEDIGGDEKEDFVADVEADSEDIDSDEVNDGEVEGDSEESEEGEEDTEDRIEDLESQLEQLRSEFATLMGQEMEEPYHDESEFDGDYSNGDEGDLGDLGGEMDFDNMTAEQIEEATKLQDEVSVSMDKEGQYAGTGDKSEKAKINPKSTYSNAQAKGESRAVDFTKGSSETGGSAEKAKDHTPTDNIDEEPSEVSHSDEKSEGSYVGTGNKSKSGKVQTKSPLSKKPAE
tara:strand:+ start:8338 stop:9222 length:885 start_codon:yes stop_codon:yes gene_type:complete